NRRVPNGMHGGVRGRRIYLNPPPTRCNFFSLPLQKYNNIVITEKSKGLKIDHFLQKSTTFCKVVEL
ncbi:hypothetical protein, partial [Anaerovibrio lipolyticus]|uniref:hypothetical protein n=1 Tax=Anaerovibrio lipolyticus TaxID=82374 RepID=UPI0026F24476